MENDLDKLYSALRNADAAGDKESAQKLASYIKSYKPTENVEEEKPETLQHKAFEAPLGVAETALSMGSGLVGQIAGGLHGAGALVSGDSVEDAANKVKSTQEAITYRPRTAVGQGLTELAGKPLELASKATGYIGGKIGKALGNEAAGESIGEVVPAIASTLMAGGSALKGARAVAESPTAPLTGKAKIAAESQKEGYVIPPKDLPGAGVVGKTLNAFGGKERTQQTAAIRNQEVTNSLARKELGIEGDLTPEAFDKVRSEAGKSYKAIQRIGSPFAADAKYINDVKAISHRTEGLAEEFKNIGKNPDVAKIQQDLYVSEIDPAHAVELTKILRKEGNSNVQSALRSADPKVRALGDAQLKAAKAVEDLIDRNLKDQPELLKSFRDARKKIAQSYDVQRVTDSAGNVDAVKLAKKDAKMTGELKKITTFASNFKKSAMNASNYGGEEGLTVLDVAAAGGSLAAGHTLAAAGILARPSIRGNLSLGKVGQSMPSKVGSRSLTEIANRKATQAALLNQKIPDETANR